MDVKTFEPIGIIKLDWEYDIIPETKTAYFEYYIPEHIDSYYKNNYCARFVFLENNIAYQTETMETTNFSFEYLNYNEKTKLHKTKFLDITIYLTNEQYIKLQETLSKYNIPINNKK